MWERFSPCADRLAMYPVMVMNVYCFTLLISQMKEAAPKAAEIFEFSSFNIFMSGKQFVAALLNMGWDALLSNRIFSTWCFFMKLCGKISLRFLTIPAAQAPNI